MGFASYQYRSFSHSHDQKKTCMSTSNRTLLKMTSKSLYSLFAVSILLFFPCLSLAAIPLPNSRNMDDLQSQKQIKSEQQIVLTSSTSKDIWSRYDGVSSNVVHKLRKRTVLIEDLGFDEGDDDDYSIKLALFTSEADAIIEKLKEYSPIRSREAADKETSIADISTPNQTPDSTLNQSTEETTGSIHFEFPFTGLTAEKAENFKKLYQRLTNKTWLNNPSYLETIHEGTGLREIIHKLDFDIPRFFHQCTNHKIKKLTQSSLEKYRNISSLDSFSTGFDDSHLVLNHTWVWFQNHFNNCEQPVELLMNQITANSASRKNRQLVDIESIVDPSDYKHIKTLTHKFIYSFQVHETNVFKYGYSLVFSYNEFIHRLTLELKPLSIIEENIQDDVMFKILLFCESTVNGILKYDNKHELTRSVKVWLLRL